MILGNTDFPVDSPFFRNIVTDKPLEYALVMFCTKLGTSITYLLIQSMNPSNKIIGDTKDNEEKDLNIERWIDDAISSLRLFFMSFNGDFINRDGSIDFDRVGLHFLKYVYYRPFYTLDKTFISELMAALSKSYPKITSELEKIRSQPPSVVAKVSHWEYIANRTKQQKICTHDYKIPSNKSLSDKYDSNILHCSKCHKNKYKNSPFLKTL